MVYRLSVPKTLSHLGTAHRRKVHGMSALRGRVALASDDDGRVAGRNLIPPPPLIDLREHIRTHDQTKLVLGMKAGEMTKCIDGEGWRGEMPFHVAHHDGRPEFRGQGRAPFHPALERRKQLSMTVLECVPEHRHEPDRIRLRGPTDPRRDHGMPHMRWVETSAIDRDSHGDLRDPSMPVTPEPIDRPLCYPRAPTAGRYRRSRSHK